MTFLFECGTGAEPGGSGIVTGDESIARCAASAFSKIASIGRWRFGESFVVSYCISLRVSLGSVVCAVWDLQWSVP